MGKLMKAVKTVTSPFAKANRLHKSGNPSYRDHTLQSSLPSSFDARDEWPGCISGIKNQESCGSCYAFSAVSFLEDRFCIKSEGQIKVELAPEDIVTCDTGNYGCNGGLLTQTVDFLIREGVTTQDCKAYQSSTGVNGFCSFSCDDPTISY